MSTLRTAWLAAILLVTGTATATEVYLNNVKVTTSLKNASFPKVDVRLDANGDVYIDAPGYKVEFVTPGAAPPPSVGAGVPTRPAGHYWVVVTVPTPNHYQMEIDVNLKRVASIPATSQQYVVDISENVVLGRNQVTVTFLPAPNPPVTAAVDAVDLIIGQGEKGANNTITVQQVLASVKRKTGVRAAEAQVLTFDLK